MLRSAHTHLDSDTVFALSMGDGHGDGLVGAVGLAVLAGVMEARGLFGIPGAQQPD